MRLVVLDYRLPAEAQGQIQPLVGNKVSVPSGRCPESKGMARAGDAGFLLAISPAVQGAPAA